MKGACPLGPRPPACCYNFCGDTGSCFSVCPVSTRTMNEEELRIAVLTEPFEPKRLFMSDGTTVDIPRPGTIAVGKRTSGVVVDGKIHTISNLHITRIEPLVRAAS